jgi:serine/threonine protein kinase
MVLESLHGGELSYNLQKFGRMTPLVAKYFFYQIVDAIAHMHSRGFCHRDLKPWNIMLNDSLSSAKVIDFSYSTPLNADDISEKCPKLKGWLSGTLYFMAPE